MKTLKVTALTSGLETVIENFNSGNQYLDNFIKSPLAYDNGIGKTYILLSDDGKTLIGYYNITTGNLDFIDQGFHKKMGGAIHINSFAIDKRFQKEIQGVTDTKQKVYISDILLEECLERIENIREQEVGFAFVTLNSTQEGEWLYTRNDFEPLEEDMYFSIEDSDVKCKQMYLPLALE